MNSVQRTKDILRNRTPATENRSQWTEAGGPEQRTWDGEQTTGNTEDICHGAEVEEQGTEDSEHGDR